MKKVQDHGNLKFCQKSGNFRIRSVCFFHIDNSNLVNSVDQGA